MREGAETPGLQRRVFLITSGAFAIVTLECVAVVLMVRRVGISLPVEWQLLAIARSLLPGILLGFVVHTAFHWIRGSAGDYLRALRSPRYLSQTAILIVTLLLLMVFYTNLKVMVPLLNEAGYDEALWDLDAALMLGFSPNVFFVNLLNQSLLLRFIDFGYGYFFFGAVLLSFPFFIPMRNHRLRSSFIAANVLLWSAGAWLYLLVPTLGPAYYFHEVWDPLRAQFPVSTYWQKQLLDNYQMVLEMGKGTIDPALSLFEGIGAFPSLHVGFQTLFALYLSRLSRPASRFAWFVVALTFIGSIVTGWHYLVDSLAGLALALGVFAIMRRALPPAGEAREHAEGKS